MAISRHHSGKMTAWRGTLLPKTHIGSIESFRTVGRCAIRAMDIQWTSSRTLPFDTVRTAAQSRSLRSRYPVFQVMVKHDWSWPSTFTTLFVGTIQTERKSKK